MADDGVDTDRALGSTVPVEAIPAPVLEYEIRDGEPTITGANDAFERVFDPVPAGTAMRRWLRDAAGAPDSTAETVCSSLVEGVAVDVELGNRRADGETRDRIVSRFRTVESGGDSGGHALLTESASPNAGVLETDRIASVISHDLRNPLDVANAHLQAARETGGEEHFEEVRQSHDRMERIIRDVLTLARGESALDPVAGVDVEGVAADAWASVETGDASLALEDGLSTVEADPDRLQRLFENLFRNSIEHAAPVDADATGAADHAGDGDAGNLQVRVGCTDGGFFVADDGPGVPPEDRTRVFDPGYSANGVGGGTGLGLTIVEEIADAHDWTVTLTTGSLGGARFEFRPDSVAHADDPEAP